MAAKPTSKQAKALQLIREGVRPVEAMRRAGYAESTSQAPGRKLVRSAAGRSIIEKFQDSYLAFGITQDFLAAKTSEWLNATKIDHSHTEPDQTVPDYQTQLKAYEFVRKDIGLTTPDAPSSTTNVLVIPSELIAKYGITSDTEGSSAR